MSDAPQSRQSKPLLVIHNVHIPSCGEPPSFEVTQETEEYYGYFQNRHGEQWVFIYDFNSETGTVRGGDAGWKNIYNVVDGRAPFNLTLNQEEQVWLYTCWETVRWGKDTRDKMRAAKEGN